MSEIKALIERRTALERLIAERQTAERDAAITRVRELMAAHGLTTGDLVLAKIGRTPSELPPRYRNRATGETWVGRGKRPRWLREALDAGHHLEEFSNWA